MNMAQHDPIEAEATERPTVAALVPVRTQPAGSLVRAAAGTSDVLQAFHDYQELYSKLLVDSDFQIIAGKKFAKKSAWRKLSVAFGVDLTIVERVYERNEHGKIIRAEVVARATAPNGRHSDGLGACDLFEKCCQPGCTKSGRHKHCQPDCPGSIHFSNPQHDLPATAETRAKNRAASDLFGMGEVSAEEMNAYREEGWWGGWATEDDMKAAHDPVVGAGGIVPSMPAEAKQRIKAWREERNLKLPMPKDDFEEFSSFVLQVRAELANAAPGNPADDQPRIIPPSNDPAVECSFCEASPCECQPPDAV